MKIVGFILLLIGSYLLGNLNFARIISKLKHKDITQVGSGNPGTLNMLRAFGFTWAIINMLLEILKGFIPALLGKIFFGDVGLYSCGLAVILGHIYPVFYKFKGGKGVAASAGMFFCANPLGAFLTFICCFTFVVCTSIGSIGTLGFLLIMSILQMCLVPSHWVCYILILLIDFVILFAHRENIKRLFQKKENPTDIKSAIKKMFDKNGKEVKKVENQVVSSKINTDETEASQTDTNNSSNKNSSLNNN